MDSGTTLCHIFNCYQRQFFCKSIFRNEHPSEEEMQKALHRFLEERGRQCYGDSVKELSHLETTQLVRPAALQSWNNNLHFCLFLCRHQQQGLPNVVCGPHLRQKLHVHILNCCYYWYSWLIIESFKRLGSLSAVLGAWASRGLLDSQRPELLESQSLGLPLSPELASRHTVSCIPLLPQRAQEAAQALVTVAKVAVLSFWVSFLCLQVCCAASRQMLYLINVLPWAKLSEIWIQRLWLGARASSRIWEETALALKGLQQNQANYRQDEHYNSCFTAGRTEAQAYLFISSRSWSRWTAEPWTELGSCLSVP